MKHLQLRQRRAFGDCVLYWASTGTFGALSVWSIQAYVRSSEVAFILVACAFGVATVASILNFFVASVSMVRIIRVEFAAVDNFGAALAPAAHTVRLALLSMAASLIFWSVITTRLHLGTSRSIAGVLIGSGGVALRSWSILFRSQAAGGLITCGPYRFVRHPRYVGTMLIYVGACLIVATPASIVGATLVVAAHVLTAAEEDRRLAAAHGERAVSYRKRVGGFFPRRFLIPATADDRVNWTRVFANKNALQHVLTGWLIWIGFVLILLALNATP
jgi:protein-S-isoprenylcysteine O-methyltransferase Ste14